MMLTEKKKSFLWCDSILKMKSLCTCYWKSFQGAFNRKIFLKVLSPQERILEFGSIKLSASIKTWLLEEPESQTAREQRTSGAWPGHATMLRGENLNNHSHWKARFLIVSPQAILWIFVFYRCGCCHYWMFLCALVLFQGGRVPIRKHARQSRMPLGGECVGCEWAASDAGDFALQVQIVMDSFTKWLWVSRALAQALKSHALL